MEPDETKTNQYHPLIVGMGFTYDEEKDRYYCNGWKFDFSTVAKTPECVLKHTLLTIHTKGRTSKRKEIEEKLKFLSDNL